MSLESTAIRSSRPASLTLVALETLPCGCISSVHQAWPTVVELELVEAKGPHCLFAAHRVGGVVRLGLPGEWDDPADEILV